LRLTELLKQPQYQPQPLEDQVISIYAVTKGFARTVPVDQIREYVNNLLAFMRSNYPAVGQAIANDKAISEDTEAALKSALEAYNQTAGYEIPKK
jgi:F-type H+-transporting ATPase subunit alpha